MIWHFNGKILYHLAQTKRKLIITYALFDSFYSLALQGHKIAKMLIIKNIESNKTFTYLFAVCVRVSQNPHFYYNLSFSLPMNVTIAFKISMCQLDVCKINGRFSISPYFKLKNLAEEKKYCS